MMVSFTPFLNVQYDKILILCSKKKCQQNNDKDFYLS